MNLIQRALVAIRAFPPPQPVTWETAFPQSYVSAGVSVNEYTSLNYSPIACGVATLARDIAKLPLVLNRNLANGGSERFKTHRLYRILHDEWNPEMTSYKARETMVALCILYGNSYAEIVRTDLGDVAGLYPIVPSRVAPVRDDDSGRLFYRVTNFRGGQVFIQPQNMVHFSALSTDGIIGHGLLEHARESIGLGIAAEKFGGSFFGNGATFGGIAELPVPLTAQNKELATNTREAIEAVHQGVERAHKILVLGANTKFTQRGTAPNEAQFTETRKFQVTEAARWLGMPAHKLGDLENAHFTNIEEQELQYYQGTVSGWLKMIEQELARKCIKPLEYSQQSIEHVMEGVLRGSSAQRADFYTKLFNIGAISVNRILQLENMNPIGPEGDVHLVPLNMIPLERYNEMIDAQLAEKKAKTEPPQLMAPKEPDPKPNERTLEAIAETRAKVAELLEQAQRDNQVLIEKVTAKLDGEIYAHVDTASAALQAKAEAEAAAEAHRLAQAQAEFEAATLLGALTDAQAETRAATEAREAAAAQAATAQAEMLEIMAKATTEAQRAEAAAKADAAAKTEAETEAATLRDALLTVQAETRTATEAWNRAKADVDVAEQRLAELSTQITAEIRRAETTDQERVALAAQVDAATEQLTQRAEALSQAQREHASAVAYSEALQGRLDAATATIGELETKVRSQKHTELDRLTNVMAAHRALIVDVLQRLLKPEMDRARRHQVTPESLRKWADAFYQTHRDVCADALYPVVMTHLAWTRSAEDPRLVAERMASEHCEESRRQLQVVMDGSDRDEFHAALERLLLRWEAERPGKLADKVLTDEIVYLRSLE